MGEIRSTGCLDRLAERDNTATAPLDRDPGMDPGEEESPVELRGAFQANWETASAFR